MKESRTTRSLRNVVVAFIFYVVSLCLNFVSRRVFIQYLGSEILGLNSTAASLLQFLNMAEMGIGTAVAFTLYKPIANNDKESIAEIVSVQGWLYKRIAIIVFISAIILSYFFPYIFRKSHLPLWYAYSTFGVLLFSAMITYIFNYKQLLLSAHQLEYKITISYKLPLIIKTIIQIVCIWRIPKYGYQLWVFWELVGAIVASISLSRRVKKEFPFIAQIKKDGGKLRKKYSIILTKVKQLLFHKIGGFVLFQTSPLIIYAYANLTLVAIYGNYMLIVSGLSQLLTTIFNGISAGVGNLMQTESKERIMSVFREIYTLRFYLVVVACYGYYRCVNPITILWVGSNYLLPFSSIILIIIIMFFNMIRVPIDIFCQANGLFQDIWAPIVEAALNLGLSILLGYYWGLNGILIGVAISLFLIPIGWRPFFLFKYGLKEPYIKFLKLVGILLLILSVNLLIWEFVGKLIKIDTESTLHYLITELCITIGFSITIFASLAFIKDGLINVVYRFIKINPKFKR